MSKKQESIQVLLCEPHKKARIVTISNTLKTLQQMVGGYIQALYPFSDPVAIICNEEGKFNGRLLFSSAGGLFFRAQASFFLDACMV